LRGIRERLTGTFHPLAGNPQPSTPCRVKAERRPVNPQLSTLNHSPTTIPAVEPPAYGGGPKNHRNRGQGRHFRRPAAWPREQLYAALRGISMIQTFFFISPPGAILWLNT